MQSTPSASTVGEGTGTYLSQTQNARTATSEVPMSESKVITREQWEKIRKDRLEQDAKRLAEQEAARRAASQGVANKLLRPFWEAANAGEMIPRFIVRNPDDDVQDIILKKLRSAGWKARVDLKEYDNGDTASELWVVG